MIMHSHNYNFYSSNPLSYFRRSDTHLYLKSSTAYAKGSQIPFESFRKIDVHHYQCNSQNTTIDSWYDIDMQTQTCSCEQGMTGKVCKHLIACSGVFGLELFHLPPSTAKSRQKLAMVAHGSCEVLSFYESFIKSTVPSGTKVDDSGSNITAPDEMDECNEKLPSLFDLSGSNNALPTVVELDAEEKMMSAMEESKLERVREATTLIDKIAAKLHSVLKTDVPDSFIEVLSAVDKKYEKCSTVSAFETLLSGSVPVLQKKGTKRMHVQPTAVSRRKHSNGSTSAQARGSIASLNIKEPKKRKKKSHELSQSVASNVLNATKH